MHPSGLLSEVVKLVYWVLSYRLLFSVFTNKLALISMLLCCHVCMLDMPPSLITCLHVKPCKLDDAAITTCIAGKLIQPLSCWVFLLIKLVDASSWAAGSTCQAGVCLPF